MPTRHRLSLAAACALVLTLLPVLPASASFQSDVVALVNASRADEGLAPLTQNTDMDAVAQAWAEHLVATEQFEHNPDYSSQIPDGWGAAAENLAGNSDADAGAMHDQLMDSPGHYANIVGDFTHIGVGIAYADGGRMSVLVEVFGSYPSALPGDVAAPGSGSTGGSTGTDDLPEGWLGPGSTGADVERLQSDLRTLGYDVTADGDYGDQTREQVEAFQVDTGLDPDGLVGPRTRQAITDAVAAARPDEPTTTEPTTDTTDAPDTTSPTPSTTVAETLDTSASADVVPTDAAGAVPLPGLDRSVPTGALLLTLGIAVLALVALLLLRHRIRSRR